MAIRIDRPHPASVQSLSSDLRKGALAGAFADSSRRVSLRSFYAYDQLRSAVGEERAARLVFGGSRAQGVLDALSIGALR